MKCSKCGYTTFDNYDICPKCGNDFSVSKKELNLLSFTLTDSNNYLLSKDEPIVKITEEKEDRDEATLKNNLTQQSTKDEVSAILENFEKSEDSISQETTEPDIEHFEIEDDDISLEEIGLEELLETNREE